MPAAKGTRELYEWRAVLGWALDRAGPGETELKLLSVLGGHATGAYSISVMATRSQRRRVPAQRDSRGFVISVRLLRDEVPSFETFPFSIPAVRELDELELHPS